ncbi:MAG: hypothetical protein BAJALOKI1v1_520020 [Promethearchaeota archaeon]|nr:MAG: hypothetical protein BAJALOKI1v1_520020 [Candidatus Lokiarchaeota archaeon]
MTNLVEKILLIGFGILMVFSFFSIITPLIETYNYANENQQDFNEILINIEQINNAVKYVSETNETYSSNIFIFENLRISINQFHIDFIFLLDGIMKISKYYDVKLENQEYTLISQRLYNFTISQTSNNTYMIIFNP